MFYVDAFLLRSNTVGKFVFFPKYSGRFRFRLHSLESVDEQNDKYYRNKKENINKTNIRILTLIGLLKNDSNAQRIEKCFKIWRLFIRFSMFCVTSDLLRSSKNVRLAPGLFSWSISLQIQNAASPMMSSILQKNAKVHRFVERLDVKCVTIWSMQSTPALVEL